jgi:antitoxin component of MazEF toxin-antitoxin module
MIEVELDVNLWGNNLGVRSPVAIVREAHLKGRQRERVRVLNGE